MMLKILVQPLAKHFLWKRKRESFERHGMEAKSSTMLHHGGQLPLGKLYSYVSDSNESLKYVLWNFASNRVAINVSPWIALFVNVYIVVLPQVVSKSCTYKGCLKGLLDILSRYLKASLICMILLENGSVVGGSMC